MGSTASKLENFNKPIKAAATNNMWSLVSGDLTYPIEESDSCPTLLFAKSLNEGWIINAYKYANILNGPIEIEYSGTTLRTLYQSKLEGLFDKSLLMENREVEMVLSKADRLLSWDENWDDEGAKEFTQEIIERTKKFLIACSNYIYIKFNYKILAPRILPYHNGSVQIFWRLPTFKLLLTIPVDSIAPITCYGEDITKTQIVELRFTEEVHFTGLFVWLYEEMKNARIPR